MIHSCFVRQALLSHIKSATSYSTALWNPLQYVRDKAVALLQANKPFQ